jgi:hypothetical protein
MRRKESISTLNGPKPLEDIDLSPKIHQPVIQRCAIYATDKGLLNKGENKQIEVTVS